MTRPQGTARDRLIVRVERAGAALGVIAIIVMVGSSMVMRRRRGVETDAIPRSTVEQRAFLADGECAVRPNGAVVGKRVAGTEASPGRPRSGYELEAIDARRRFHVGEDEVRIVPCVTLQR